MNQEIIKIIIPPLATFFFGYLLHTLIMKYNNKSIIKGYARIMKKDIITSSKLISKICDCSGVVTDKITFVENWKEYHNKIVDKLVDEESAQLIEYYSKVDIMVNAQNEYINHINTKYPNVNGPYKMMDTRMRSLDREFINTAIEIRDNIKIDWLLEKLNNLSDT